MSDANDKLSPRDLTQQLSQLPPKKRLDLLLSQADTAQAIAQVPAEDLYVAIAEVGLEDAVEIVQLASPAQFRTFVDLAGWRKDRIEPSSVLTWLRAARGDDEEAYRAKLQKLDLEVLEYVLRTNTVVHDLEEDPDANPQGLVVETPEGKYLVEITAEGVDALAIRQVINDLIAADPLGSVRFMEAVRWEVPSELEEIAYRFRSARLADLGFPELYDALAIFAYADPEKGVEPAPVPSQGAALAQAQPGAAGGYLEAAFRDLGETERPQVEAELRYLINSALVAEGAEPSDLEAIRRVSELARDVLTLGLEHATRGSPAASADQVRRLGFKKLFQLGFSLALKLKFRADRLVKAPLFAIEDVPLLLPDEARAVTALRRKRPMRALRVEGADPVPFRSKRELAESEATLDRAHAQLQVFGALLGPDVTAAKAKIAALGVPLRELGADGVWLAVVARAAVGESVEVAPFPAARAAGLVSLFEAPAQPVVKAPERDRVLAAVRARLGDSGGDELTRMVDWALVQLRDELGAALLKDGKVDEAVLGALMPVSVDA